MMGTSNPEFVFTPAGGGMENASHLTLHQLLAARQYIALKTCSACAAESVEGKRLTFDFSFTALFS